MKTMADIVTNFDKQLSALICRKTNQEDHCHDILQNVYVKILQNIDKVEKAKNLKAYLLKIADNSVSDYYRTKKRNNSLLEINDKTLSIRTEQDEDKSFQLADCCLRPMIESLEPIYREALILTELEGWSQKQLAQKAGISLSGAKSRVQRAKEKLKDVIVGCCSYKFDKYGNIIAAGNTLPKNAC